MFKTDPDGLTDFPLSLRLELGRRFIAEGCTTFYEAFRFVRGLPYERLLDPQVCTGVIDEKRGTCSTKHALLFNLCEEHGVAAQLMSCIYLMNGVNTPGVEKVLDSFGLHAIPESHCYLRYEGVRLDATSDLVEEGRINTIHCETSIESILYKVEQHRAFLEEWGKGIGWSVEELWSVRELCIEALTQKAAQYR